MDSINPYGTYRGRDILHIARQSKVNYSNEILDSLPRPGVLRRRRWKRPRFSAPLFRQAGGTGLAELSDASHFYDRGFLLPVCKTGGLVMIRVDSIKSLAVLVKQSHLPVMVFSTLVCPK